MTRSSSRSHRRSPRRQRFVLRTGTRTRLLSRQRIVIATSAVAMLTVLMIVLLNISDTRRSMAASAGDYRTNASGNWNAVSTWETFDGSSWVSATTTPSSSHGTITVRNGNSITITSNVAADQVEVESSGQLTVNSGNTFTIANGTGTDLTVNGILVMAGTVTISSSGAFNLSGTASLTSTGDINISSNALLTILNGGTYNQNGGSQTTSSGWAVNNGGTYVHNINGGTIPTATWGTTSTCKVTGVTTQAMSGLAQSFGHFIYNCTGQTASVDFNDNLRTINGNFTVLSTGTGSFKFDKSSSNVTLNVSGNYSQSGGLVKITHNGNWNISITGDFNLSGGNFVMTSGDGVPGLTVNGTFTVSGGTFDMSQFTGSTSGKGIATLTLNGDLLQSGGTITETATNTGKGIINFSKSGIQSLLSNLTVNNTVEMNVISGTTLYLSGNTIDGSASFTLAAGSGLGIGASNGISSSGSTGNIQVNGTRTFSTAADYTYNGTSDQTTGNGLPSTVNNLTLNNSSGLSLSSDVTVNGIITLTSGKLTTGSRELVSSNPSSSSVAGYSSSSYVVGNLRRNVSTSGTYDFPLGTTSNYELASITLSSATGFTNILGSFTNSNPLTNSLAAANIQIAGNQITDMLDYGYWTLTPNSSMTGGTYTIALNERGHSNASDPITYCVLKQEHPSAEWESLGTHSSNTQSERGGVAVAVRSGLTSFSKFAIGKSGGSLPIELVYFDAKLGSGNVECRWETATEINNDFFTIERSSDGKEFSAVTTIDGAGNSTSIKDYTSRDENPLPGRSYYRLKQTDYDGKYTYSQIETIKNNQSSEAPELEFENIFPIPFKDHFTLAFHSSTASETNILLQDATGQLILQQKLLSVIGSNKFEYTAEAEIPPGIYFITIADGGNKISKKIIKN